MDRFAFYEEMRSTPNGKSKALRVDVDTGCGLSLRGVAYVLDVDGPNPLLHLPKPLGLAAVRRILTDHAALAAKQAGAAAPPE